MMNLLTTESGKMFFKMYSCMVKKTVLSHIEDCIALLKIKPVIKPASLIKREVLLFYRGMDKNFISDMRLEYCVCGCGMEDQVAAVKQCRERFMRMKADNKGKPKLFENPLFSTPTKVKPLRDEKPGAPDGVVRPTKIRRPIPFDGHLQA